MKECKRCGYRWIARTEGRPKLCPGCKTRKWDEERRGAYKEDAGREAGGKVVEGAVAYAVKKKGCGCVVAAYAGADWERSGKARWEGEDGYEVVGSEKPVEVGGCVHGLPDGAVAGALKRAAAQEVLLHGAPQEDALRKAVAEDGCDARIGSAEEVLEKMMRAVGMSEEEIQRVFGAGPEREKYPWET